jgi:hypothetical protein
MKEQKKEFEYFSRVELMNLILSIVHDTVTYTSAFYLSVSNRVFVLPFKQTQNKSTFTLIAFKDAHTNTKRKMDVDKKKKRSAEDVQPTSSSSSPKRKKNKNKTVIDKDQRFEDWKTTMLYLTSPELGYMCTSATLEARKNRQNKIFSATRNKTRMNFAVTKLMPYMVCEESQVGGHALTREFLFDVLNNFSHLYNLLEVVSSEHEDDPLRMHVGQIMFPPEDSRLFPFFMQHKDIRAVTFAMLTACAKHVRLKLSLVAKEDNNNNDKEEEDEKKGVFDLSAVTSAQQTTACEWLDHNWSDGIHNIMLAAGSRRHPKEMPVFDSDSWWKFVKSFFRLNFGFGLRMERQSADGSDGTTIMRTIVANSFYARHNVDVLAVIANHREQTLIEREPVAPSSTTHNGRKFGQYPVTMRNCDLCPPGGAPVPCVRQFGSQWRCTHAAKNILHLLDTAVSTQDRVSSDATRAWTRRFGRKCHRDYNNQIDVGYLDEEPPPSNKEAETRPPTSIFPSS